MIDKALRQRLLALLSERSFEKKRVVLASGKESDFFIDCTGGSSLEAVEALRAVGANVVGVAALVDREEGGSEAIRAAGLALSSLTSRRDFMG